jgi:hypothetical protein
VQEALCEYIKVPNQSPLFDKARLHAPCARAHSAPLPHARKQEWETNGYLESMSLSATKGAASERASVRRGA